ncbi:glutamine synthetase family protein [Sphingobacterium sp. BIGb0165]|uniref:glutamine synthetase family protein n=1 Tax=Sphingobacterium sp. BIGb0165 TaxID=2940615 RepID=UPI002168F351|nr:glutamine synthetase family protein [Sphingobacterium sp. BIGb0165]MCS4225699.1 glutamine synthetase [Sphingobacterium sp. BIGb0165]
MIDKKEIISKLKASTSAHVKVAVADIDGVLRGKFMHRDKFISSLDNEFGFCSVVFGWDVNDQVYDNVEITGWHTGYGDFPARIDGNTFRKIPWQEDVPFFLADFESSHTTDQNVCPRALLKNIIAQSEQAGYKPIFAQEFEWFNFIKGDINASQNSFKEMTPITSGMFGYSILRMSDNYGFFRDLLAMLEQFGIPLEGLHTETGPGVMEAAIQCSNALEAADRATLFKSAVKEIGKRHGIVASFMAKQTKELPGCSGHVHQSLWDLKKEKNLFYDANDQLGMSELMKQFLAGQLYCLRDILPLFAPTVNSYKRLTEGAWAPTTLTWGIDNRTTALRVIDGGPKATRIEHRVVGSDVNPYLAIAACLASGLYGIKHKLSLDNPYTVGNGYKDLQHGVLPRNLYEATNRMAQSEIASELFGEKFVDHFCKSRLWEWRQFSEQVTDWETKRYFEII